ncbi:phosphatase PAP2 family protein [Staphylococcus caledonicus]|uniref:phosphatase PAP2 family protein n=1 Tax=Staphylococcus sp. acrmy TaxID=2929076 RepID=UPI001F576CEA|nr:phosphatase PAP2 family protein [Staphylococcus sp. acrmy]MCI2948495.1 phosphatase PAP2 family protein [Staphylococcus sp. acrmy]
MKQKREFAPSITVPMFIVGLLIFIFAALNVIWDTWIIQHIDLASLHWVTEQFGKPQRNFQGNIWHNFITFCAEIGEVKSILYITAFLALILLFKNYKLSIWLILSIYTGTLLNYLIKQMVERQRPYNHLIRDHGFSFPSGHSNASTLLALTLLIVVIPIIKSKALRLIISLITVIIWLGVLWCRVYFHAHYIIDVVGGVSLGMLWIALYLMIIPLFYLNFPKKPENSR